MGENPSRRDRFFSNRTQFSSLRAHSVGRPISRRHAERPRNGRPIPREESAPEPRRRRHRRRPRLRLAVHAAHHASRARARRLRGPPAGRRRHGASARARGGIFGRSSLAGSALVLLAVFFLVDSLPTRADPSSVADLSEDGAAVPTRDVGRERFPALDANLERDERHCARGGEGGGGGGGCGDEEEDGVVVRRRTRSEEDEEDETCTRAMRWTD